MTAYDRWLEQPYQERYAEDDRYIHFCDYHADSVREAYSEWLNEIPEDDRKGIYLDIDLALEIMYTDNKTAYDAVAIMWDRINAE